MLSKKVILYGLFELFFWLKETELLHKKSHYGPIFFAWLLLFSSWGNKITTQWVPISSNKKLWMDSFYITEQKRLVPYKIRVCYMSGKKHSSFTDNDGTLDNSKNNFYRLVFATSIKNLHFSKFLTENWHFHYM